MKTSTKTQLIQACFNKTVLKKRTKLLTTLLAIIGLLSLILIASSNYLKYHMYRLGFESILRIKDNVVEKVLEKEQGFNLATTKAFLTTWKFMCLKEESMFQCQPSSMRVIETSHLKFPHSAEKQGSNTLPIIHAMKES